MPQAKSLNIFQKIKIWVLGRSLDPSDKSAFTNLTLIAFFAWVGLGADGLSSSAYGPEEMFVALGNHHHLAILLALGSVFTVFVISATYSQVIELFPHGGGGYAVSSKILSPRAGMMAGCALLIDYILTISISLASASAAIFSFLPLEWQHYKLHFALAMVLMLTLMNLRGVKESIMVLVPIFLVFVFSHLLIVLYGIGIHVFDFRELTQSTLVEAAKTREEIGIYGMLLLLLKAYSMGAGTFTGIEAVSTGTHLLREPRVKTGKRTMVYMAFSLAFMVMGLMLVYVLFHAQHVEGKTLNAVVFQSITSHWNSTFAQTSIWILLFSEAAILFVAAQAGFLGGPRVMANMALDQWLPNRFALLSDRLVNQNGIMLMGGAAAMTLLLTGASVHYLVVLYSIMVFVDFSMVHFSLVRYNWKSRAFLPNWRRRLGICLVGLFLCVFILVMVVKVKFFDGGWITILAWLILIGLTSLAKRHYQNVSKILKKMDSLVQAAQTSTGGALDRIMGEQEVVEAKYNPKAKTAVMLVSGFNGLGLHTLFSIIRLFGGIYKNFVFVEIGLIDAGSYKGVDEVENLKKDVEGELAKYVEFIKRHGYYGESVTTLTHDVVEGSAQLAPKIIERFPQAVFFMGQLVFPEESWISRLFHNNTVFALQRKLYHLGIPFLILPIRVKMKA